MVYDPSNMAYNGPVNMFDQFDNVPAQQAPANMFDQFDEPTGENQNAATANSNVSGARPFNFSHAGILLDGDLLRGALGVAPSIVDFTDRIPTWAANTALGTKYPYPPSINQALQEQLDKVLPTPQNTPEAYQSAAVRNVGFGLPGMITGAASQGIQQYFPNGAKNITVGGRDMGVSPNDVATGVVGMAAQGATGVKPFVMKNAADTDAARIAQVAGDNNIPVYPTDIADPNTISGQLAKFFNATPMSGKAGRASAQQGALTQAAIKAMGTDADELSPPVMDQTATRLGQVYTDFAKNNDVTPTAGNQLVTALGDIQNKWGTLDPNDVKRLQAQLDQNILPRMNQDYSMTGDAWNNIQQELGSDARAATSDEYGNQLYKMQGAVRQSMRDSLTPDQYEPFDTANNQYRAMLALEPAAKKAIGNGNIDPTALSTGANRFYPNTVYNDPNAIPQMSQVGQMLNKSWKDSGASSSFKYPTGGEVGQALSLVTSPATGIMNRLVNGQITPMDWKSPFLAEFYRANRGLASIQQNQPQR